jgi:hypothetical protein
MPIIDQTRQRNKGFAVNHIRFRGRRLDNRPGATLPAALRVSAAHRAPAPKASNAKEY